MADLEALQKELKAAKEKWPDAKLGKAKKEEESFPYPIWLKLAVQQPPAAAAFDVLEIPVKMFIDGLEPGQTRVEVKSDEIPTVLQPQIEAEVLKMWKKHCKKAAPWGIMPTLDWVEANFSKLLLLDPACVGPYDGCDENGASMRRYALAAPAAPVEEEEEEEDVDSEEEERNAQEEMARRIAELLADTEDSGGGRRKLTQEEIDRKKKEAEEMGERARTLSKAERAELNKSRKERAGHRQAKTGPSGRKFEGDGAVSKEEKKKRQEANVKKRFGLA
jgi:superfamily II DNA/RNA helicase